jgi:S-DNA-T family DNA segregation ATPase FtsK/SpoIIIE
MTSNSGTNREVSFLQRILLVIKRFGQDLFGILLICIGVISVLSAFNLTQGKLIDQWAELIFRWFGWGAYFLIIILAMTGVVILLRHLERFPRLDYIKLIVLEVLLFSFSALLSVIGGFSVERANDGLDGGVIGWGTARLARNALGDLPTYMLLIVLNVILLINVLGLHKKLLIYFDVLFTRELTNDSEKIRSINTAREKDSANEQTGTIQTEGLSDNSTIILKSHDLPSLDLLLDNTATLTDESFIHAKAVQIEKTLEEFGIPVRVAGYRVGPTIIQYAIEPGFTEKVNDVGDIVKKKVRVSQIAGLRKDLALALSVDRLRIEAPIPGHAFVGVEIPNRNSVLVRLKAVLESIEFKKQNSPLSLALGLDVSGNPIIADLVKMPHLLIAGTTGSGKSVCITSIISCIVMNNSPRDLRIAILDPKMVELVRFNGLPHLIGKVETQIDRMLAVLAWAIKEMEERYKKLEELNARDLDAYNQKMFRRGKPGLPKIVIVIDELADLMLSEAEKTETYVVRLAQMARATGIHLVVATQRPSTDIITGLIKANFPARISFMMASSVDSRVILDMNGAETLMGKGDMLFLDPETAGLKRAQCVLVDDREIERIINHWQSQSDLEDDYSITAPWENFVEAQSSSKDNLLDQAIRLVQEDGYASTSRLQRKLRIGFPRAARLMDELEEIGVVGPRESGGRVRKVNKELDSSIPEEDDYHM